MSVLDPLLLFPGAMALTSGGEGRNRAFAPCPQPGLLVKLIWPAPASDRQGGRRPAKEQAQERVPKVITDWI